MSTLETAHVLHSHIDSDLGTVVLQVGDVKSETAQDDNVPLFQTPGVVSLPAAPTPGESAAEVVLWKTDGADVAIAARDVRTVGNAGNIVEGETCVYAPGSQAYALFKNDGAVTIGTTSDNARDGFSVYYQCRPAGHYWNSEFGSAKFDSTGFHVSHTSGAKIDLGAIGGFPSPLDALGSYFKVRAAIATIEASIVSLGPASGTESPAAKSIPLLTYLTALNAALAVAIDAAGPGGPAAAAAFTTAAEALVVTLTAALPSSVSVG